MNTCDTCKWWMAEMEEGWNYRSCGHPKNGSEEDAKEPGSFIGKWTEGSGTTAPAPPNDGSWAAAHDYYSAFWCTGPKFGCIHHETK